MMTIYYLGIIISFVISGAVLAAQKEKYGFISESSLTLGITLPLAWPALIGLTLFSLFGYGIIIGIVFLFEKWVAICGWLFRIRKS